MPLAKGDYILLDYTVIVKDEGKVIETSQESVAKEAGIYRPEDVYGPRLVIIGETPLWEPVENALLNLEEGQEFEVEVPPEKAYGVRDPNKVKIVSIREFHRHGVVPSVGDVVDYEGQRARVISISGGRVVLDFNHPLAGKAFLVKGRVVKKLSTLEDKAVALLRIYLPRVSADKIKATIEGETLTVTLPAEVLLYERIGGVLLQYASEVSTKFQEVKRVRFIEEVELKA
ncbi:peptidylprolyl isomerase [Pyrobaculum aerophilum]|uniref:peptidylprolyl isomerase n=2 Tax=Pyrobaculum aerophilum TaxID=13773 RepID=Q8ZYF3_PYRAE|nr:MULTISPECIES: peptidylprolyl isomerase [Pyrobaculum]AAL63040.1 FKBP-type peptidyl-prolyl cis-trans isomerases [Pyrobaculum aerophilum str. IM2]MCX8136237.1 peptidylprolyl isomerase [Pyrobaculum aerophilum]RFA98370.1 peptidylprolyl isomerase [Pyrobaculum aerophilum]HII48187.1 peptidylprolyl isomerase [Pyrobaculum aerophilum]